MQPHQGLLVDWNGAGQGEARRRQIVALDRGESFQVIHGRQVKAAGILKDISAEQNATISGLGTAHGCQAALDVEADLGGVPGPMRPQSVDADHGVAIIGPVGGIDAAAELLCSVKAGPNSRHGRAGEPRIIVGRPVNPGTDDDVPAVVGSGQIRFFQLGIERHDSPADERLPVIIRWIAIDQDLVRIDGDLRGPPRQFDHHAHAVVREEIHGGLGIIQLQVRYLGKNGDTKLVAVAVIEANA